VSHIIHGDDPNEYPHGEITPGTFVFLMLLAIGALVWAWVAV
jgi:hypothetical protein